MPDYEVRVAVLSFLAGLPVGSTIQPTDLAHRLGLTAEQVNPFLQAARQTREVVVSSNGSVQIAQRLRGQFHSGPSPTRVSPIAEDAASPTLVDKWKRAFQNNRVIAIIIFASTIVICIGAFTDALKSTRELLFPPKPEGSVPRPNPRYAECRDKSHGIETPGGSEGWEADSDWIGGGSSPAQFFAGRLEAHQGQFPTRQVKLVRTDESHKSEYTPFKQDYYKYHCWFRDTWEPIYKLNRTAACGLAQTTK